MHTIDLQTPLLLGTEGAVKIEVLPLMFSQFVELTKHVLATRTGKQRYESLLQRARIKKQCTFITTAGKKLTITDEQLVAIPASVAKGILPHLTYSEGVPGMILAAGDGVTSAIHYKFGTAIKAGGEKEIAEVEFLAKTYGDLEDVLAGEQMLFQAMDLITTLGRPVGSSLQALPSWALDQITMADGLTIMNKILPSFLE